MHHKVKNNPKRQQTFDSVQSEKYVKNEKKTPNCLYDNVWKIIDSLIYQVVMTLITIYTLFFDDFWVLALPVEADDYCFGIVCAIFLILSLDILINFVIHKDYRCTFFFWLDIVSTFSLIADIGWLTTSINNSTGGASAINAT